MDEICEDIKKLVNKVTDECAVCNPQKGVLLCNANGCVNKKLYGLLIECLCLKEEAISEKKGGKNEAIYKSS